MQRNMVTRTIKSMEVTIRVADADAGIVKEDVINVPYIGDEKKLKKHIAKTYDTDTRKFMGIISVKTTEKLYGLDETKFLEIATVLPPRNANKEG